MEKPTELKELEGQFPTLVREKNFDELEAAVASGLNIFSFQCCEPILP
jgi:hypothetical protein